jgi:hypothetical protein
LRCKDNFKNNHFEKDFEFCQPHFYKVNSVNKKYVNVAATNFIFARDVIRGKSIVLMNAGEQDILRGIGRHRKDIKAQKKVRKHVMMPLTDVVMVEKNIQVNLEHYCKLVFAE